MPKSRLAITPKQTEDQTKQEPSLDTKILAGFETYTLLETVEERLELCKEVFEARKDEFPAIYAMAVKVLPELNDSLVATSKELTAHSEERKPEGITFERSPRIHLKTLFSTLEYMLISQRLNESGVTNETNTGILTRATDLILETARSLGINPNNDMLIQPLYRLSELITQRRAILLTARGNRETKAFKMQEQNPVKGFLLKVETIGDTQPTILLCFDNMQPETHGHEIMYLIVHELAHYDYFYLVQQESEPEEKLLDPNDKIPEDAVFEEFFALMESYRYLQALINDANTKGLATKTILQVLKENGLIKMANSHEFSGTIPFSNVKTIFRDDAVSNMLLLAFLSGINNLSEKTPGQSYIDVVDVPLLTQEEIITD